MADILSPPSVIVFDNDDETSDEEDECDVRDAQSCASDSHYSCHMVNQKTPNDPFWVSWPTTGQSNALTPKPPLRRGASATARKTRTKGKGPYEKPTPKKSVSTSCTDEESDEGSEYEVNCKVV